MTRNKPGDVFTVSDELARTAWFELMENACSLLDDALLLEGSPRSVALLTLCMEEASKADLIWELASHMWGRAGVSGVIVLKSSELRWHRVKLIGALGMTAELGPFWGHYTGQYPTEAEASATADALNARKMSAFYVDVAPGAVTRPGDLDLDSFRQDAERVAGVLEMCLIREHTRAQDLEVKVDERVGRMHEQVLPAAHPELFDQ